MTFDEILQKLQSQFPNAILGTEDSKPDRAIKVAPFDIPTVIRYLKEELRFETLGDLCAVDYPALPAFCVVYHLQSYAHKTLVCLKAYLPRENGASLPSITSLFKAANWFEREAYDMVGIGFSGHPDMRRILCPEDWVGHPLRKDYVTPDYYNGMPVPLFFEEQTPSEQGEHSK
ncbi:MAG: NADH-quinone oxidoreductase subunit C [Proteobacteria bacterium]|nr:NADH-quinone oxidoreductase subunit C [Pseudomonadota bacterium]